MRGHRQDSAQKWGLPCRWLFLFFLGKNRCETDLCSKQTGGENPLDDGIKKRNAALCFEILTKRSCKRSNFNRLVKAFLVSPSYNYRPPSTKKGEWHATLIQKSKTGVEFVLRSTHRAAQLQRTLPPLQPLLQAKFSHHCGGLSPLRK